MDALGRTVETIERNGPNPEADWYVTRYTYDIRGNLITVTDALGRVAFRHVYDLADNALRIENIDAGIRRTILDAPGSIIEQRDSKGAVILNAYDVLNRPVRLWARDGAGEPVTLREYHIYGDSPDSGLSTAQAVAKNLLGMPFKHYDEAGLVIFEACDFKGNILEKARQVISDDAILAVLPTPDETPPDWQIQPFRVDWHPPDGTTLEDHAHTLLDVTEYRTSIMYDALNRIKILHYPEDVDGERKELRTHYNLAGALEQVELDGDLYVEHIAYNARGQRTLIAYGNGVMTRYSYDSETFRLVRLRTEGYTNPDAMIYQPAGDLLQDFAYKYDLAGNITAIHDRTPECGIPSQPDRMDRHFSYDPLYRLLEAKGRECGTPPAPSWDNGSRCTDINSTKGYRENYEYDPVGNMACLKHNGGPDGFTRKFVIVPGGNRLSEMRVGEVAYAYIYDANGNLISESTVRHFEWDHSDQMRVYRTQIEGAEPSIHAHYLYDASGQRVKKLVRKQGDKVEVTVYIDGIFEYHHIVQGSTPQENNTLHVMDDEKRIALIRVGSPFPGDVTAAVKYHLGDHLGSSNVVIDEDGNWINREEYTPYGETGFGSFAKKQYRFTGKERDEESGLYYHGARYYAPWLGRWVSCDPAGMVDGSNLYMYSLNNPIRIIDSTGKQGTQVNTPEQWKEVEGFKSIEEIGSQQEISQHGLPTYCTGIYPKGNVTEFVFRPLIDPYYWRGVKFARGQTEEAKGFFGGLFDFFLVDPVNFLSKMSSPLSLAYDVNPVPRLSDVLRPEPYDWAYEHYEAGSDLAVKTGIIISIIGLISGALKAIGVAGDYFVGRSIASKTAQATKIAPKVNVQKQAGHIPGTPQYINRLKQCMKQGKPTSSCFGKESANRLNQKVWREGHPVPGRPNIREKDFGISVGEGPKGGMQKRFRVHKSPKTGKIHGHPTGPEHY